MIDDNATTKSLHIILCIRKVAKQYRSITKPQQQCNPSRFFSPWYFKCKSTPSLLLSTIQSQIDFSRAACRSKCLVSVFFSCCFAFLTCSSVSVGVDYIKYCSNSSRAFCNAPLKCSQRDRELTDPIRYYSRYSRWQMRSARSSHNLLNLFRLLFILFIFIRPLNLDFPYRGALEWNELGTLSLKVRAYFPHPHHFTHYY
jgi:hypothetical protein